MRVALALLLLVAACKQTAQDHVNAARTALYEKKPQDALHEYRLALEVLEKDDSPEAQVLKARVLRGAADVYYLELRDMKNAVQVYRELIHECPEAPETLEGRMHLADILATHFHDLRGAIN